MKKITYSLLAIVAIVSLVSCSNDTYSSRLKSEKELITDFIHRQGIQVVNEIPEVWGEKDYYLVPEYDYMYYHLDQLGDTTKEEIKKGDQILLRYRKYSLDIHSDTTNYWTSDDGGYPIMFRYQDYNDANACIAWHVAVGLMKYSGSSCKIICPSKLGFDDANTSVTPYGYDISILVKRF